MGRGRNTTKEWRREGVCSVLILILIFLPFQRKKLKGGGGGGQWMVHGPLYHERGDTLFFGLDSTIQSCLQRLKFYGICLVHPKFQKGGGTKPYSWSAFVGPCTNSVPIHPSIHLSIMRVLCNVLLLVGKAHKERTEKYSLIITFGTIFIKWRHWNNVSIMTQQMWKLCPPLCPPQTNMATKFSDSSWKRDCAHTT